MRVTTDDDDDDDDEDDTNEANDEDDEDEDDDEDEEEEEEGRMTMTMIVTTTMTGTWPNIFRFGPATAHTSLLVTGEVCSRAGIDSVNKFTPSETPQYHCG